MVHSKLPLLALASTALAGVVQRDEQPDVDPLGPGEHIGALPAWVTTAPALGHVDTGISSSSIPLPHEFQSDRPEGGPPHSTYFPSAPSLHLPSPTGSGSPPFLGSSLPGQGEFAHTEGDSVKPTPAPAPEHDSYPHLPGHLRPPPHIPSSEFAQPKASEIPDAAGPRPSSAQPPIPSGQAEPPRPSSSNPQPPFSSAAVPSKPFEGIHPAEPTGHEGRPPWAYDLPPFFDSVPGEEKPHEDGPPPFESGPGESGKSHESGPPPFESGAGEPGKDHEGGSPPFESGPGEPGESGKSYEGPPPFESGPGEPEKPHEGAPPPPPQSIPGEPPKAEGGAPPESHQVPPPPAQYEHGPPPSDSVPGEPQKPHEGAPPPPPPSQYTSGEQPKPEGGAPPESHELPPPPPPAQYENAPPPVEGAHPTQPPTDSEGPSPNYAVAPPVSCPYAAAGGHPAGPGPHPVPDEKPPSPPAGDHSPPPGVIPHGSGEGQYAHDAAPPQGVPAPTQAAPIPPAESLPTKAPLLDPEADKPHHIYGPPPSKPSVPLASIAAKPPVSLSLSTPQATPQPKSTLEPQQPSKTNGPSAEQTGVKYSSLAPRSFGPAIPVGMLVGAVGALVVSLSL